MADSALRVLKISTVLACGFAAAVSAAEIAVKRVEGKRPLSVAGAPTVAVVALTRTRTTVNLGTQLGLIETGLFCSTLGPITMTEKLWARASQAAQRGFRSEMTSAGHPSPVRQDSSFDDKPRDTADFEAGVLVSKLQIHACNTNTSGSIVTGAAYVEAKWELFSKRARKVVYDVVTEGSYHTTMSDAINLDGMLERAFAAAARNLLAQEQWRRILVGEVAIAAAPEQMVILPPAGPAAKGGVPQNVTMLRASVITIISGAREGSGFFVSAEGHALTNQHVVGELRFVRVKLATGREVIAEVIKVDRDRDVALIKTEPIGVTALSIRTTEANIGEDVYAIGSPLGDTFSGSVTRGVLSGHRKLGENRYLQSDVAVLPGSSGGPLLDSEGRVVGIAARAVAAGLANLNLFVPIGDALASLSLKIGDAGAK